MPTGVGLVALVSDNLFFVVSTALWFALSRMQGGALSLDTVWSGISTPWSQKYIPDIIGSVCATNCSAEVAFVL